MATAKPLQKIFPTKKNTKKPFINQNLDDEEIYGEVHFPQFTERNKLNGECSNRLTYKRSYHPCTKSPSPKLPMFNYKSLKTPPPLPFKPHHLRHSYNSVIAPPIPPRVVNQDAIKQRKQLAEEYFENVKKNIKNEKVVMLSRSVKIPGTESRPYWTIEDSHMILAFSNQDLSSPPLPPRSKSEPQNEFIKSLIKLKETSWYWCDLSWEDAELMMSSYPDAEGLFLVRDSQDPHHILTLTVRSTQNTIHHIRIEHNEGKFHLYEPTENISEEAAGYCRHTNIISFINLAVQQSLSGTFLYFVKPKIMGEPPIQIRFLKSC